MPKRPKIYDALKERAVKAREAKLLKRERDKHKDDAEVEPDTHKARMADDLEAAYASADDSMHAEFSDNFNVSGSVKVN
jgi:hypothetical protein